MCLIFDGNVREHVSSELSLMWQIRDISLYNIIPQQNKYISQSIILTKVTTLIIIIS